MQKKTFIPFLIHMAIGVTFLAGCGVQPVSQKDSSAGQAIEVQAMTIRSSPFTNFYEAPGTVSSKDRMQISSKIMGRIVTLPSVEGMRIAKGQLLFELADQEAAANLDNTRAELTEAQHELDEAQHNVEAAQYAKNSAEADLSLATQMYSRYEELLKRNSVSQQEFDNVNAKYISASAQVKQAQQIIDAKTASCMRARAHIERAKANVRESEARIGFTKVFAPASGIIASKQANVGDMAVPGVPLLTLDSEQYRLEVSVDESRIPQIHAGDRAFVLLESLDSSPIPSTVEEIVPAADPSTRSSIVKLSLSYKKGLHSGIFGRARFSLGRREAIRIPSSSIINRGQLTMVYVIDSQDIARLRLVKTGQVLEDNVEILSGLQPGENIVVSKTDQLQDGMRVKS